MKFTFPSLTICSKLAIVCGSQSSLLTRSTIITTTTRKHYYSSLSVEETNLLYEKILSRFQIQPNLAFAYGSAVFKQKGTDEKAQSKNVIDFIFAVDNPIEWHRSNILANPTDYSFLKSLPNAPKLVTSIQDNYGAKIYYNTLIPWGEGRLIKYGVISTDNLLRDLEKWETLYVAGRLHKPVKFLRGPLAATSTTSTTSTTVSDLNNHNHIVQALRFNSLSALRAALLLLPSQFTFRQLLMAISSLSYTGDFRMTVGENPNKIANIVEGGLEHFIKLYSKLILTDLKHLVHVIHEGDSRDWTFETKFEQNTSAEVTAQLISLLPEGVKSRMLSQLKSPTITIATTTTTTTTATTTTATTTATTDLNMQQQYDRKAISNLLHSSLASIISGTAISQSLKGIITAGAVKAVQYAWEKIKKMKKSSK